MVGTADLPRSETSSSPSTWSSTARTGWHWFRSRIRRAPPIEHQDGRVSRKYAQNYASDGYQTRKERDDGAALRASSTPGSPRA